MYLRVRNGGGKGSFVSLGVFEDRSKELAEKKGKKAQKNLGLLLNLRARQARQEKVRSTIGVLRTGGNLP